MNSIPDGFEILDFPSPFLQYIGPIYVNRGGERPVLGLRVEQRHTNARGTAHGGLLLTLADVALGYVTGTSQDPPTPLITANLTADFASAAYLGDWLEVRVDIIRASGGMGFANAFIYVGDKRIFRASGVFGLLENDTLAEKLAKKKDG